MLRLAIRQLLFLSAFILFPYLLSAGVDFRTYEYSKFTGTIGSSQVVMNLNRLDSVLEGEFYFSKDLLPQNIAGRLMPDNSYQFYALTDGYEEAASFELRMDANGLLKGTWEELASGRILDVLLAPVTDDGMKFVFMRYFKEDCSQADANKLNFSEDMSYSDTMCSVFELVMPRLVENGSPVLARINRALRDSICGSGSFTEQQGVNNLMGSYFGSDNGTFEFSQTPAVTSNEKGYISVCMTVVENYFGAHPMYYSQTYNFNLADGDPISLEDLFLSASSKELNRIAERTFTDLNGTEDWFFEPGNFEVTDDFTLTPLGIRFNFDPYEIGPFGAGSQMVFLKYSDIAHLMKKGNPAFKVE